MKSESPRNSAKCFILTKPSSWWWTIRPERWFVRRAKCFLANPSAARTLDPAPGGRAQTGHPQRRAGCDRGAGEDGWPDGFAVRLREPQLRGLAEPFSVTMDFGELPAGRPLVLVLNGWLRFGGGMANVAASLDPNLPFPFPTLEAELPDGTWKKVDTDVGVPAGKTKTILVDLEKKLPPGARRLRLTTAFELYWISPPSARRLRRTKIIRPLWFPGTVICTGGDSANLPRCLPRCRSRRNMTGSGPNRLAAHTFRLVHALWRGGRTGPKSDDALVLLNGGDELALSFQAEQLPARAAGFVRDFFLYAVGWDKDADFHVGQGWRVEPLPFHGMNDQAYDHQQRPAGLNDGWMAQYNTRWIGPMVLSKNQPF